MAGNLPNVGRGSDAEGSHNLATSSSFIQRHGKDPLEENGKPLQYSYVENSLDRSLA